MMCFTKLTENYLFSRGKHGTLKISVKLSDFERFLYYLAHSSPNFNRHPRFQHPHFQHHHNLNPATFHLHHDPQTFHRQSNSFLVVRNVELIKSSEIFGKFHLLPNFTFK